MHTISGFRSECTTNLQNNDSCEANNNRVMNYHKSAMDFGVVRDDNMLAARARCGMSTPDHLRVDSEGEDSSFGDGSIGSPDDQHRSTPDPESPIGERMLQSESDESKTSPDSAKSLGKYIIIQIHIRSLKGPTSP